MCRRCVLYEGTGKSALLYNRPVIMVIMVLQHILGGICNDLYTFTKCPVIILLSAVLLNAISENTVAHRPQVESHKTHTSSDRKVKLLPWQNAYLELVKFIHGTNANLSPLCVSQLAASD